MTMDEIDQAGRWLTAIASQSGTGERRRRRRPRAPEPRAIPAMPFLGFESVEEARRAEEAFLSLSGREATVLAYLAYGLSAKEIAKNLNLSCRTVDTFRTRALLKLRARNTADAVRMLVSLSAMVGMGPLRDAAE